MRADRLSIVLLTTVLVVVFVCATLAPVANAQDKAPGEPPQSDASKPAPPAAAEAPKAPAAPAAPAAPKVVDASPAHEILGRSVIDAAGHSMGRIVDVIVDPAGHVLAAVIDFGGFLGVGSRKIAVDWAALRFEDAAKKGADVKLELTKDQLKAAPEYKSGKPLIVIGASGGLKPLDIPAKAVPEK
jgi:hypothetical protein